jgi:hypothetical protein
MFGKRWAVPRALRGGIELAPSAGVDSKRSISIRSTLPQRHDGDGFVLGLGGYPHRPFRPRDDVCAGAPVPPACC